ncbi:hypothetical protein QU577_26880 [Priestia megaterium]|uniref:hypothetical protein n=1 Tax=Priestia megaterium TaxID=1404 RepID=UPI0025B17BB2|nr:hypothetical protein [Priestia megaterium]MDN3365391.1 hypothetical protein [Priestia megaterium]
MKVILTVPEFIGFSLAIAFLIVLASSILYMDISKWVAKRKLNDQTALEISQEEKELELLRN